MSAISITALFVCPNVIILSATDKTETKGSSILKLINQIRTSEDENCGESRYGINIK
jgi:hypothetical protein